jgi:hypothetical protein
MPDKHVCTQRYISNISARTKRSVEQSGLREASLHCSQLTSAQTVIYFLATQ